MASTELKSIAEYILCHHERWDGAGYPQGLRGKNIPLLARVISVVDAYDAMTSDRSYRKAMTREDALAEISKHSGSQFDPEIAALFLSLV
jgi:HD-GYP domain-containing protein (c-di-GMP phosphodiesterase class II)